MNRWICPNDRQLALRAQLGTGWSFFSHRIPDVGEDCLQPHCGKSAFGGTSSVSNEELRQIAAVLRRKELCDQVEQERVGHMVVHLEKLKGADISNGGPYSSPQKQQQQLLQQKPKPSNSKVCHMCGKATITLLLHKLLSVVRRRNIGVGSGGNLCGASETGRGLCGWGCHWCGQTVCDQCSCSEFEVTNQDVLGLRSPRLLPTLRGRSGPEIRRCRVCRSCLETREIWKRSGAWQFQELPQYRLPRNASQVCPHPDTCSRVLLQSSSVSAANDLAKIDSASWEAYRRPPPRWSTLKESDDQENFEEDTEAVEPVFERFTFNPFETGVNNVENDCDNAASVENDEPIKSEDRVTEPVFSVPPETPTGDQHHADPPVGSKFWSKESFRQTKKKIKEDHLGVLSYRVYHDSAISQLIVTIDSAKDLKAMDSNGLSDPYVKCHMLPGYSHKTKLRTKTCYKTLNPTWRESLVYHGISRNDMDSKTLRLAVLDEDTIGFDWIGEYRLFLADLNSDEEYLFQHELIPRQPIANDSEDLVDHERGKILMALMFDNANRSLHVTIVRCAQLASMDANGFSDPFCKIYLKPDRLRISKRKTQTKKMTLNPYFNEEFIIELDTDWNRQRTLEVSVWDYDRGPTNDFIGGVKFHYRARGDRGKLWRAVFDSPNRRFEGWFILCADLRKVD